MFGERAFEKRSSRLLGTSVYFSTCFTLICLLLLHKAGSKLEVILSPHEVFVGETFSVSCLLNSSRLAQGLTLGREGIWNSDANKNENQNGRDFDSFAQVKKLITVKKKFIVLSYENSAKIEELRRLRK